MLLLPIFPGMFPHAVVVSALAEGVDAEGGVVEVPQVGATLACRVKLDRSMPGYRAEMEVGVTPARLAFARDPGLKKGDRLTYLGRDVRVLAPARPRDGDAVLFDVDGELID